MKKLSKIAVMALLVLSLAGCSTAKLKNGEAIIAKTSKGNITAEDVYEKLKEKYGTDVLIDLIDEMLLDGKFEDGLDDDVDAKIEQIEAQAEQYGMTLEQYVKSAGLSSIDEAKELLALNYKKEQAAKEYIRKNIEESEIKDYYENNIDKDINCKHILIGIDTKENATEKEIEQAKTKALNTAKEVIKKLNAGENWDELAKEYSSDSSTKDKGGDLGYFNKGDMVEEFEKAAYKLKVDEYTKEPVKTTYGYHIIYKVAEKKKASLKSLKEEIINTLTENKLSNDSTMYYKALDGYRKDNGLDIKDSDLSSGYKKYLNQLLNNNQ